MRRFAKGLEARWEPVGTMSSRLEQLGPKVFVPGMGKSGTSTFCELLERHPKISFGLQKEPYTFLRGDLGGFPYQMLNAQEDLLRWNWNDDCEELLISAFDEHFADTEDAAIIRCDGSQPYLQSPDVCHRIAKYLPESRFVILLRHPVKRTFSHYFFRQNAKSTSLPFLRSIAFEWSSPVTSSFYVDRLTPWLQTFPRERFLFFTFEEFIADHERTMHETCDFLGIEPIDFGELGHEKKTQGHYSQTLQRSLNFLTLNGKPPNRIPLQQRTQSVDDALPAAVGLVGRIANRILDEVPKRNARPKFDRGLEEFLHELMTQRNKGLGELIGKDVGAIWNMDI